MHVAESIFTGQGILFKKIIFSTASPCPNQDSSTKQIVCPHQSITDHLFHLLFSRSEVIVSILFDYLSLSNDI